MEHPFEGSHVKCDKVTKAAQAFFDNVVAAYVEKPRKYGMPAASVDEEGDISVDATSIVVLFESGKYVVIDSVSGAVFQPTTGHKRL